MMLQGLDFAGPGLPLEETVALFQRVAAFRALKIETLPAGPKYSAVLEATGGRLHVSGGWAVQQLPDALRRGVHAFIPSTMEPLYCRIYAHFAAGREAEAVPENQGRACRRRRGIQLSTCQVNPGFSLAGRPRTCALGWSANVRLLPEHVRFTPESRPGANGPVNCSSTLTGNLSGSIQ